MLNSYILSANSTSLAKAINFSRLIDMYLEPLNKNTLALVKEHMSENATIDKSVITIPTKLVDSKTGLEIEYEITGRLVLKKEETNEIVTESGETINTGDLF